MSNAELSIQLQADSIAAVKAAMIVAVDGRPDNTLWWLVDYSHDIIYQNRISGAQMFAIDQQISNVMFGPTVFGNWFSMQNSYFSSDRPIPGVSTLKQAIEIHYRWRVSGYFNDVMSGAASQTISPQYVFPNPDFVIGTCDLTAPATGTFTHGPSVLDSTKIGPGILSVKPTVTIGSSDLNLTLSAVYQNIVAPPLPTGPPGPPPPPPSPPPPPASILITVDGASDDQTSFLVGEQSIQAYNASSPALGAGIVEVEDATKFLVGQWVLLREDLTQLPDYPSYFVTEVAEVQVIDVGNHRLTLGQPRLVGVSAFSAPGLRNSYSASSHIYPLFVDVKAVGIAGGNADDAVTVGFDTDRPQGFLDISTISYPQ